MSLYFIAVEPNPEMAGRIKSIQLDFKTRFNSRKAYDSFPHITLVPPFRFEEKQEKSLIEEFHRINLPEKPFEVNLSGFGSFENRKNPVIFIKPNLSEELTILRNALINHFTEPENFFHPHITVAYKDLSPEDFRKAWLEYQPEAFSGKWTVESVELYKHFNRRRNLLTSRKIKKP